MMRKEFWNSLRHLVTNLDASRGPDQIVDDLAEDYHGFKPELQREMYLTIHSARSILNQLVTSLAAPGPAAESE